MPETKMETEEPGDGLTSLVLEVVNGQGFGFHHTHIDGRWDLGSMQYREFKLNPLYKDWTPLTARLYSWGSHGGKGRGGPSFQI